MASPPRIRVMISSRCNDPIVYKGKQTALSTVRIDLKKALESEQLLGSELFEVWINEDAPPAAGTEDSWEHCIRQVEDADLVIVLNNGNSGWAREGGELGICHGELQAGLARTPGKIMLIELPLVALRTRATDRQRDIRFRGYVERHNLFRGRKAETGEDVIARCREAIREGVVNLARSGAREARKGRGYAGDALDWSRLSYPNRRAAIERTLHASLAERDGAIESDRHVFVPVQGQNVLFMCHGIPAGMGVPAARELVGQPFLLDHQLADDLERGVGPVHLIGCAESITKSQAMKILGFPDAMIVDSPFGVYVASDIQKIQLIFVRNCIDESATRAGVQRLFEWLEQWGEAPHLSERARQRAEVVRVIAAVNARGISERKQAAKAQARHAARKVKHA